MADEAMAKAELRQVALNRVAGATVRSPDMTTPSFVARRRGASVGSPKALVSALFLACALGPASTALAGKNIDFGIAQGKVVPTENFAVKVTMLGSAITSGGEDMPVTMKVQVQSDDINPFGDAGAAFSSNVNDHAGPRSLIVQNTYAEALPVSISATSWKRKSGVDGNSDSDYTTHYSRDSHGQHSYVKVLRHGDPVPNIPGFEDQASIETFVEGFIDPATNTVVLGPNDAIFLFELGVSDLDSAAADFQDLVVLVTLGESPQALAMAELEGAAFD